MSKQTEGKPITSEQVQLLSDRCWPYLHLVDVHDYYSEDEEDASEVDIKIKTDVYILYKNWRLIDYGNAITVGLSHKDPEDAVIYSKDEQRAVAWLITDYIVAQRWPKVGIIDGTDTLKSALWLRLRYNKIECVEYEPIEDDERRYRLTTMIYPEIIKSLKARVGILHREASLQAELSKLPKNELS